MSHTTPALSIQLQVLCRAPLVRVRCSEEREDGMALDSLPPTAFAGGAERRALFAELQSWLGNRFSQAPAVREQHGHTLTWIENQPPEAVAFPHNQEEVVRIVKVCLEKRVPIIAFG